MEVWGCFLMSGVRPSLNFQKIDENSFKSTKTNSLDFFFLKET